MVLDNKHINITLASAKQAYEELTRLTSLAELERCEFGSGLKRERIEDLLKKLNASINSIQHTFSEQVSDSTGAPILALAAAHRRFYNEVIVPHGKCLQRAYFEITGMGMLVDILDDPKYQKPKPITLNAMSWALERWSNMLDEDESFDWHDRGFNISGAEELVGMPWFQPDEWLQNLKLLQPVLIDRKPEVMRDHVRYRLTEIYRAFTYGLWMSALALSRSLVEFTLKANAKRLGISPTYDGRAGTPEDKSLKKLGEDVAKVLPELAVPIEKVRETGNRILHPKKQNVIAHPHVMSDETLDCILATRLIVETLYSEIVPE